MNPADILAKLPQYQKVWAHARLRNLLSKVTVPPPQGGTHPHAQLMADKFDLDWGTHTPGVLLTKLALKVLAQAETDRESGSYIKAYEAKSLQEWAEHSEHLARAAVLHSNSLKKLKKQPPNKTVTASETSALGFTTRGAPVSIPPPARIPSVKCGHCIPLVQKVHELSKQHTMEMQKQDELCQMDIWSPVVWEEPAPEVDEQTNPFGQYSTECEAHLRILEVCQKLLAEKDRELSLLNKKLLALAQQVAEQGREIPPHRKQLPNDTYENQKLRHNVHYNIKLHLSKKYREFRLKGVPYQGSFLRCMRAKINRTYQLCCEQGFEVFPEKEQDSDPEHTDEEELAKFIAEGHHWEEWKYTMVPPHASRILQAGPKKMGTVWPHPKQ